MWLFGLPSICDCVHNWLDNPINLFCRRNRLFNRVDDFGYITALLLSFRLFTLHFFSPICCVGTTQVFTVVFTRFFAFFPVKRSNAGIVKLVESPKCHHGG
jgi:hypothetical protein